VILVIEELCKILQKYFLVPRLFMETIWNDDESIHTALSLFL
jgi:hypothetical protein